MGIILHCLRKKICLVEDDEDISLMISYRLEREGYQVSSYFDGKDGLIEILNTRPDLVILDLMVPGLSGFEICKRLKENQNFQSTPIIMLTARGGEDDIVKGLSLGAVDYMTKPFSMRVLLARIESALRQKEDLEEQQNSRWIKSGKLSVHTGQRKVLVDEKDVALTESEFQILSCLLQKKGWVFSRAKLVDTIRGENYAVSERTIDFQMVGLRKKLLSEGKNIETIRGVGYKFKDIHS